MDPHLGHYREVWVLDYEFHAPPGERPKPLCLVALELRSRRAIRLWRDQLLRRRRCPIPTDDRTLWVCYFASAEMSCLLALGWNLPRHVLDLYVEFRVETNSDVKRGRGLLDAMLHYRLEAATTADQKELYRDLAIRGGPFTTEEQALLLTYCEADAGGTARLFRAMLPNLLRRNQDPRVAFGQALLRGRYMIAVARMEHEGIPVDADAWRRLQAQWEAIQARLVAEVDAAYGVFEGLSFREHLFADYLTTIGLAWPRLASGRLALDRDTFREMAQLRPELRPMYDLRYALAELRLNALTIGSDGRNRVLLSPFASKTGRNLPSSAKFIFGPSSWIRSLIRPEPGMAIAYLDWQQQELGIAAAISGDPGLIDAYRSGDPYLAFAIDAGLAPRGATKESHGLIRDACKACVLGINYGMKAGSLARRIGRSAFVAKELLRSRQNTYPIFWRWSDQVVLGANARGGSSRTVFGWPLRMVDAFNPRAAANFPCQGNGAEMLRLACCLMTEAGVRVCAPVHDAVLITARVERIDDTVAHAQGLMAEASRVVLSGLELSTDAKIVRWPDRIVDDRGSGMWQRVMRLLEDVEGASGPVQMGKQA